MLVGSVCLFGGCNGGDKTDSQWYRKTYYGVMNTGAELIVYGDGSKVGEDRFNALDGAAESAVRGIENSLSVTLPASSIAKFNAASAGATVEIDQTAYEVLSIAQSVYTLTEGYYNPAVYYNVLSYGFDGNKNFPQSVNDLPSDAVIAKYNELSAHFNELEIKKDGDKYYAVKPAFTVDIGGETYAMKIDLGGIGKGYAVDKVNALIDDHGYQYGYFNFGSSSIAFKRFSAEEGYALHLTNARAKGESYLSTSISNECVSTSGDYENYFLIDGVRYCHVFSPVTGKPVETGIMTATVIGGSAAEADALTTALMAMGKEKAAAFIDKRLQDRRVAISVEENGAYGFITNMPAAQYTLDNDSFTLLNTLSDGKIVLGE